MVARYSSPSDTKEQAVQIGEAWTNIGQDVVFGEMTLADFQAAQAALEATETTIANLKDQLTSARNEFYEKRYVLWKQIKGARLGQGAVWRRQRRVRALWRHAHERTQSGASRPARRRDLTPLKEGQNGSLAKVGTFARLSFVSFVLQQVRAIAFKALRPKRPRGAMLRLSDRAL